MTRSLFVRIVPSLRTIPGVEAFDYKLPDNCELLLGDIIRIPFRRQTIEGMVVGLLSDSPFAAKAREIEKQQPLLRLGEAAVQLLQSTAARTFSSQPTVLGAWLRTVPKRAKEQSTFPLARITPEKIEPCIHFAQDRWEGEQGLLAIAQAAQGSCLIITPWRHRAEQLAERLAGTALHADITDTEAWKAVQNFCDGTQRILITTRVGAWLSCVADTIFIDEPEHDDHKQDEQSPRYDARWLAFRAVTLRPGVALHTFSTTPRLQREAPVQDIPTLATQLMLDPWVRGHRSKISVLTEASTNAILEAVEEERQILIIHAVEGLRGHIACRDCGWSANCPDCGFSLSQTAIGAHCRRCGKKSSVPDECPQCGGLDLSRGRMGREALQAACDLEYGASRIQVVSPLEADHVLRPQATVVLTDVYGMCGATEDIRRKERLAINLRRLAARCAALEARLIWHGTAQAVEECAGWLSAEGLLQLWAVERRERALFSYPPMARLIKVLIDEPEGTAIAFSERLRRQLVGWSVRGPMPIPFRAKQRSTRFVLHLLPPTGMSESELIQQLAPFADQCLLDLDPVSFFC